MRVSKGTIGCNNNNQKKQSSLFLFYYATKNPFILSLLIIIFIIITFLFLIILNNNKKNNTYRGIQYWKDGVTLGYETLYETSFARFQIHKVLLEDKKTIINDWLWYDESNNINILVEKANSKDNDEESTFIVLNQTKYGINGSTYAVVGGLIEENELPIDAAKRELKEELNMISNIWIELGSYVAAANRGGGITYTFWARNATKITNSKTTNGGVAEGELERQDQIVLTKTQLLDSLLSGQFKEIKWTATVALALLREQHDNNNK